MEGLLSGEGWSEGTRRAADGAVRPVERPRCSLGVHACQAALP